MAVAEEKLKQELQTRPHSELDIENVDDGGPFIEMVRKGLFGFLPKFGNKIYCIII